MNDVRWSAAAEDQLAEWIAHLAAQAGERMAERAYAEVTGRARKLVDFPDMYRASELWDATREIPLSDWKKLLVYRVEDQMITVLALYDQRQDLSALNPLQE